MAEPAVAALRRIGVPPRRHRTRQLTRQMCRDADAVFCMTREQRTAVEQFAPEARGRTFCLDPARDIADPAGTPDPAVAYLRTAQALRENVRARLRERLPVLQSQVGG
jgi:protein-tyrosine-phosphatase